MLVSELQIGQSVTVGHWFTRIYTGDDYAVVTGKVIRKMECYQSVELHVTNVELGHAWKYLWINNKDEILSINN